MQGYIMLIVVLIVFVSILIFALIKEHRDIKASVSPRIEKRPFLLICQLLLHPIVFYFIYIFVTAIVCNFVKINFSTKLIFWPQVFNIAILNPGGDLSVALLVSFIVTFLVFPFVSLAIDREAFLVSDRHFTIFVVHTIVCIAAQGPKREVPYPWIIIFIFGTMLSSFIAKRVAIKIATMPYRSLKAAKLAKDEEAAQRSRRNSIKKNAHSPGDSLNRTVEIPGQRLTNIDADDLIQRQANVAGEVRISIENLPSPNW